MNRHRAYWPLDDAPLRDGDSGFVGVDERLDPELLGPGMVSSATNCRFRNGLAEPRKGITILPWMKADGRTPFTSSNTMHVFKVAPPAAYADYIGGGAPFGPEAANNDALIGVLLSEIKTVQAVEVRLNGSAGSAWSSSNAALYPAGVLVAGRLFTTAYTANLALVTQGFQIAISLNALSGVLVNRYLEIRVLVSTGSPSPIIGYLTYA